MALNFDELECNPFYRTLQTKFVSKYDEAQKKMWLICVPHTYSLKGQVITQDFVDTHVLKPSPFFKSHFLTTDGKNSVSFEIEDGDIHTPTGTIKVLIEEVAYNEDYKPFKILIIEKPLSSFSTVEGEQCIKPDVSVKNPILSLPECKKFLLSLPGCEQILENFDKKIKLFSSSYIVLPQYLEDAAMKLQEISNWASKELQAAVCLHTDVDDVFRSEIAVSSENYLFNHVHCKLFPVIKMKCFREDEALLEKLLYLYESDITPDQLGVREPFCCPTPSAIVELASMNSKSSPSEKLQCLMTTLELLNQDIEHFLSVTSGPVDSKKTNLDSLSVSSDDLIPLLVGVLIQTRPQYLISNLHYIQNFCWELSSINKYSFGLVTFQAAKEFLKTSNFDFLKPSAKKVKKELSLEELMEVTAEIQKSSTFSAEAKPSHNQSAIDHQLSNVTKMIEASTSEFRGSSFPKDCSHRENRTEIEKYSQDENLGDFLSSLRQSSLGLSYGKQS